MICGSRNHNRDLADRAKAVTARAWYRGHRIVVGDAYGIDAVVVHQAEALKANYCAYGINVRRGRNLAQEYQYVDVNRQKPLKLQYRERDHFLVDMADIVVCCWNEQDKFNSGTYHVFEYAIKQGKRTLLYGNQGLLEDISCPV